VARKALRLPQTARTAQRALTTSSARLANEAKSALPDKKAETTPDVKTEEDSLGLQENAERGLKQAPNREGIWSRSQRPRAKAMTGPRFEQTDFDVQVRTERGCRFMPMAADIGFLLASITGRDGPHPQATSPLDP
jgi:hypothetical protein